MKPKVVSIFSGGGFLDIGFMQDFDIVLAYDTDPKAVKAYTDNIGHHAWCIDVTKTSFKSISGEIDGLIGGPPCQDYSMAGRGAGETGDRGKLVYDYLNKIDELKPKWFLFENVKGLVSKKHIETFNNLLQEFDNLGYAVSWKVLNAWHYGVAQNRERVFIVGIRKDLNVVFEWPELIPEGERKVLRDAIGDLPALPNNEVKLINEKAIEGYERRYGSNKMGAFSFRVNEWDKPSPTIQGRIFNEGKAFVHPELYNHQCFNNVGCNPTWEHANRVTDLDKPAPTRTGKDRCDGINNIKCQYRRFTVRECMRIQSIPDWYVFDDSISLTAQYRIVGNGVPCLLAEKLAGQIVKCLYHNPK